MPLSWLESGFLTGLLQIVAIDLLLGGDNAVVIALACRRLPAQRRTQAILGGVLGAIALRTLLLFLASQVLEWPLLKVVGGLLLLWIGIKLLLPDDEEVTIADATGLWRAIWIIVAADAVMSLDNVIAIAGAADGHLGLLVTGVLISIPIIVWGSRLVLWLMDRLPLLVVAGGALLGWIAGGMLVSDAWVSQWLALRQDDWAPLVASAAGATFVVVVGLLVKQLIRVRQRKALARTQAAGR